MLFGRVEELVVLLVIILVLFGAKKLPQLSKGIADSVKEVRRGFRDDSNDSPRTAQTMPADGEKNQSKV